MGSLQMAASATLSRSCWQSSLFCVAYGGLRAIDFKTGDIIVISPATGTFSVSDAAIANATGATVVAVSRNSERLEKLRVNVPLVKTVVLTGHVPLDTQPNIQAAGGLVDVAVDISPPAVTGSTIIESCMAFSEAVWENLSDGWP